MTTFDHPPATVSNHNTRLATDDCEVTAAPAPESLVTAYGTSSSHPTIEVGLGTPSLLTTLNDTIHQYCRASLLPQGLSERHEAMLQSNMVEDASILLSMMLDPDERAHLGLATPSITEADAATIDRLQAVGQVWDITKDQTLGTGLISAFEKVANPSLRGFLHEAMKSTEENPGSSFTGNYRAAAAERFENQAQLAAPGQLAHVALGNALDVYEGEIAHTNISWENRPELHANNTPPTSNLDESLELYVGKRVRPKLNAKDRSLLMPIARAQIEATDPTHYPLLHLINIPVEEKAIEQPGSN